MEEEQNFLSVATSSFELLSMNNDYENIIIKETRREELQIKINGTRLPAIMS